LLGLEETRDLIARPTSSEQLRARINEMEQRLRDHPADADASVRLADALLRLARATTDIRPANRAATVLVAALSETPAHYDALRMLGAIYLSQHRFAEALETAGRARDRQPDDAWNYGVIGDALIELGDYDHAFATFDTMVAMRPNATAYARVAYARELRGDLDGAVDSMQMAEEATAAEDSEARAWYAAQLGELYLRMERLADADRAFRRSAFLYPDYPHAITGTGKVTVARGDRAGALAIYLEQLKRTPTLDLAWRIGDLYAEQGHSAESERYYVLAEEVAGPDNAQTEANLALFLAEHDRRLPDAVKIAERVAASRRDIFTEDALAWAYYKAGRFHDAAEASDRALRTGTRDERIRSHAAAIHAAMDAARIRRSRSPDPAFSIAGSRS
jgi:tetratricopeptide (TPR) repeat protein